MEETVESLRHTRPWDAVWYHKWLSVLCVYIYLIYINNTLDLSDFSIYYYKDLIPQKSGFAMSIIKILQKEKKKKKIHCTMS